MAAQSERTQSDTATAEARPIEVLTENGFKIIRPWEADGTLPDAGKYIFLVRSPHEAENEQQVTVEIADNAAAQLKRFSRGRIGPRHKFWIGSAERHLVNFLIENDRCPPQGGLLVVELSLEDFDQALRWSTIEVTA